MRLGAEMPSKAESKLGPSKSATHLVMKSTVQLKRRGDEDVNIIIRFVHNFGS